MKKIYVISGATGLLANEIYQYLSKYKKNKVFFSHYEKLKSNNKILTFDYSKPKLVCNILDEIKCDVFIHTAGLTNIDECQKNKEKAKFANIEVTKNLIKACKISKKKIKFIYISTDQLFNGKIKTGYSEVSKVKPLNFYAKTKILSENFIKKNYRNYLILRTNFFGKGNKFQKSFSDKIIQNFRPDRKLKSYGSKINAQRNFIKINIANLVEHSIVNKKNINYFKKKLKKDFIKNNIKIHSKYKLKIQLPPDLIKLKFSKLNNYK